MKHHTEKANLRTILRPVSMLPFPIHIDYTNPPSGLRPDAMQRAQPCWSVYVPTGNPQGASGSPTYKLAKAFGHNVNHDVVASSAARLRNTRA